MNSEVRTADYRHILHSIVLEIKSTRLRVANRINTSLVQMYWNIGKRLSDEHLEKGYGSGVVEQLSVDLKHEFADASGFSPRNLWDMKRFYEFYSVTDAVTFDEQKLPQLAAVLSDFPILRHGVAVFEDKVQIPQIIGRLPWGHHLLILNKVKNVQEALFYVESAVEMGWTRDVLLNFIKADTYKNTKKLPKHHNFEKTLPSSLQEQATEMLKSTYNLGFLGVMQPIKERDLERRLVEKIKLFLLELGNGFSFIGNQYRLTFNQKDYFVDLLFFNRQLKSLVAIDLKIGSFEPEYIGKMNFYLGLLDEQTRMPDENQSIGIILCADKDCVDVEIALRDVHKPIGVADYQLHFPTEDIKKLIRREIAENWRNE